jgi:hypothetical protein
LTPGIDDSGKTEKLPERAGIVCTVALLAALCSQSDACADGDLRLPAITG